MSEVNIGTNRGKVSDSTISVSVGEEKTGTDTPSSTIEHVNLPLSSQERTLNFIDKYLVPIYERDGIVPVLVILCALLTFVLLAFYLGIGNILMGWLQ